MEVGGRHASLNYLARSSLMAPPAVRGTERSAASELREETLALVDISTQRVFATLYEAPIASNSKLPVVLRFDAVLAHCACSVTVSARAPSERTKH